MYLKTSGPTCFEHVSSWNYTSVYIQCFVPLVIGLEYFCNKGQDTVSTKTLLLLWSQVFFTKHKTKHYLTTAKKKENKSKLTVYSYILFNKGASILLIYTLHCLTNREDLCGKMCLNLGTPKTFTVHKYRRNQTNRAQVNYGIYIKHPCQWYVCEKLIQPKFLISLKTWIHIKQMCEHNIWYQWVKYIFLSLSFW